MKKAIFAGLYFAVSANVYAVEGGFELESDDWAATVRVNSSSGSCSATVVTPQLAITSAHCVERHSNWRATVTAGHRASKPVGFAEIAWIDPRYDDQTLNYDIAILRLSNEGASDRIVSTVPIQTAEQYLDALYGSLPHGTVFTVGYGLDGRNDSGTRKGALLSGLGMSVGDPPGLYLSRFRKYAATPRPGDSGGSVYGLYDQQVILLGAHSGSQELTIVDDGESYTELIHRTAPIAASLCIAPASLLSEMSYSRRGCDSIEAALAELSLSPFDADVDGLLWQYKLLAKSPQRDLLERATPSYMLFLAVEGITRGVKSPALMKKAGDYSLELPPDQLTKDRIRAQVRRLEDYLQQTGEIPSTAFIDVAEFADDIASGWFGESRGKHYACDSSYCPQKNRTTRNLAHRTADGNWDDHIVLSSTVAASDKNTNAMVGKFVCAAIEAGKSGDDQALMDLLDQYGFINSSLSITKTPEETMYAFSSHRLSIEKDGVWYKFFSINEDLVWLRGIADWYRRYGWEVDWDVSMPKAPMLEAEAIDGSEDEFYGSVNPRGGALISGFCATCMTSSSWRSNPAIHMWGCE